MNKKHIYALCLSALFVSTEIIGQEKEKDKKEAISGLIAAVKKVAIDNGVRENIPDDMVNTVILKELKLAKEQLDTCPDSRDDLKAEYQFKYDVIKTYAPQQMSEDEIKAFVNEKFADLIATKNKGMIMKTIMPELQGKADGKMISQVINNLCK